MHLKIVFLGNFTENTVQKLLFMIECGNTGSENGGRKMDYEEMKKYKRNISLL